MTTGLQKGDRVPNFQRHNAAGQPVVFYDAFCGRPVVLIVTYEAQVVHNLSAIASDDAWDTAIMVPGSPQSAANFSNGNHFKGTVFADDGAVTQHLAGQDQKGSTVTLVLSTAAQILARFVDEEVSVDTIRAVYKQHRPPESRVISRQAPALLIDHVFEPEFCQDLIRVYHEQGSEASGVLRKSGGEMVYQADQKTKIRREHRISDQSLKLAVEERLARRVLPEIQIAYQFPVTRYEAFKIVSYDASQGGFFKVHRDNNGVDTAHRRFALTINLNADEYQGGELRFPEYSDDRYKPATGSAVVFSCSLAHEALPVTTGVRYALVSFFYGENDQLQKTDYRSQV